MHDPTPTGCYRLPDGTLCALSDAQLETLHAPTPTLLANASADLEAAAANVELSLKPRSGVVLAIADLRLLAELARAVAEMDRRAVAYSPGPMRQWNADTEGCVMWAVAAPPRSLCAALAATRQTQGEGLTK